MPESISTSNNGANKGKDAVGHNMASSVQQDNYKSHTTRALRIGGVMVTSFGTVVFALPYWYITTFITRGDCQDNCVAAVPSVLIIDLWTLGIIAVSASIGFLPYALFLISRRKHRR